MRVNNNDFMPKETKSNFKIRQYECGKWKRSQIMGSVNSNDRLTHSIIFSGKLFFSHRFLIKSNGGLNSCYFNNGSKINRQCVLFWWVRYKTMAESLDPINQAVNSHLRTGEIRV